MWLDHNNPSENNVVFVHCKFTFKNHVYLGRSMNKKHGIGTIPQTAIINPGFNVLNCDLIITPLSSDEQIPANDSRPGSKRIIHTSALDSTMLSHVYSETPQKCSSAALVFMKSCGTERKVLGKCSRNLGFNQCTMSSRLLSSWVCTDP